MLEYDQMDATKSYLIRDVELYVVEREMSNCTLI